MAIEQRVYAIGICKAAADLSAKQFHTVKVTAAMAVNLTTVAGAAALGILQNKPKADEAADVLGIGVSKIKVGVGGLAAGAQWEAGADGRAITVTAAKVGMGTVLIGAAEDELATVTIGVGTGATIAA